MFVRTMTGHRPCPARRRSGREHQTVGELKPPPVAAQHGSQSPPDAAVVKLVLRIRTECVEYLLPLLLGEPAEIELIMIAQENSPLTAGGPLFGLLHRFRERARIGCRQRIEQVLIDLEVEHHVHAVASIPEILHVGLRQHIRFSEDDGIADAPLQEFAKRAEHVVLFARLLPTWPSPSRKARFPTNAFN